MRSSTVMTACTCLVICAGCRSVEMSQPLALSPLGDGVRLTRGPRVAPDDNSAATALAQQPATNPAPVVGPTAPRQQLASKASQLPAAQSQPVTQPVAQAPRTDLAPTMHRASRSSPHAGWQTLALTPQQRPIEVARFGNGSEQVLLVGPLGGGEPEAVALADSLAEDLLGKQGRLGGLTVTIVRDANPDGSARGTVGNSRHVQLDRNFASRDWRRVESVARTVSGEHAQSESETTALAELIEELRPRRIVQLKSRAPLATVHSAGPAEALARQLSDQYDVRLVLPATATVTGSLASFAGEDRQIPTLVINVPARRSPTENWNALGGALHLALGLNQSQGHTARATEAAAEPVVPPGRVEELPSEWRDAAPPAQFEPQAEFGRSTEEQPRSSVVVPPAKAPEAAQPAAPQQVPILRDSPFRLPSTDRVEPAPDPGKRRTLPQAPIPFYPRTSGSAAS